MKIRTSLYRYGLCLLLLILSLSVGQVLAQEVEKAPLPLPLAPVVTLASNIQDGVEQGTFTIASPDTAQFKNAESVDWLAVNPSTRTDAEGSLKPSDAGSIEVSAADLQYAEGHIISFSMVNVAALADATYTSSSRLIFCYPVYEACQDPETLVRALPPPLYATITLATESSDEAQAQAADDGAFQVDIPLRGSVILNARGFSWTAENSNNDSVASGTKVLDEPGAQFAASSTETVNVQFGSALIQFTSDDVLRFTVHSLAEENDRQYSDSHPVTYWYCEIEGVVEPDCEQRWNDDRSSGDEGAGGAGGAGGAAGAGGGVNCLNTDEAAPIVVCANAAYTEYTLYGIVQGGTSVSLSSVTSSSSLLDANAAANSNLASGTNSAADKTYTVSYDGNGTMTLSTFYADKGPDVDKAYVITIDEHHTVRYQQW